MREQMTRSASPLIAALAVTGVALCAWPAAAEINPGQEEGLGLTASDVPEILKRVQADPYAPATCEAAYHEVAQLDQILGPDADEPEVQKSNAGNLLVKGARSLIPYRGVFRMLTGVDRKERELADAAMAGWARRGFLKAKLRGECSQPAAQVADLVEPPPIPQAAPAAAPAPVETAALPESRLPQAVTSPGLPSAPAFTVTAQEAEINPSR
jgi:hypothetical protein